MAQLKSGFFVALPDFFLLFQIRSISSNFFVSADPRFPTTSWTLIQKIQKGDEAAAAHAMEEVCRQYWYPVYAFARRTGLSPHDAEDVTQDVFISLISLGSIRALRASKGRMRTFMLGVVVNVISKRKRDQARRKRGGGELLLSLDDLEAEGRYQNEPADVRDAESIFDRAWAERLLARAEQRLKKDFEIADNLDRYEQLREFLPLGENETPYPEAARKMGIRETALRLQIHRMRKRYARCIEEEIAETVDNATEAKAELEHLMSVVGR